MIRPPSSRGVFRELFGWEASAMRREGLAGAAADVANRMIAGITRRDVIRRVITELTHAAAPRGKSKKLSSPMPAIYASDRVPSLIRQQPEVSS
jgi:hypothetical protein